jgi:hypothetical protein
VGHCNARLMAVTAVVVMESMVPGKAIVDMLPWLKPIIASSKWLRR